MSNFKRLMAMMLTVLMIAGSLVTVGAFTDEDGFGEYTEAISVLYDLGIIKGFPDGSFGAEDDVTRQQMAIFVVRAMTGNVESDWKAGIGAQPFADLNENHYIGAITYAYQNKIVKGTSENIYDPDSNVTYQDALTMVVRLLGYGSEELDAGYPGTYIQKAIDLGLTKNVAASTEYDAAASRGVIAQVIYNAIFANAKSGKVIAKDVFDVNIEVMALTITNDVNLIVGQNIVKDGYVGLSVINDDGSYGHTYYFAAADLGIADQDQIVGKSYRITGNGDFSKVYAAEEMPSLVLDSEGLVIDAGKGTIEFGGVKYDVVEYFSEKLNGSNVVNSNNNEIIVYDWTATGDDVREMNFVTDAAGNILKNGQPYIWYIAQYDIYGVALSYKADGTPATFREPTFEDYMLCDKTTVETYDLGQFAIDGAGYDKMSAADMAEEGSVYYKLEAYDDDDDGMYERAVYRAYKVGNYGIEDGESIFTSVNGSYSKVTTGITAAEATVLGQASANANWCYLWAYNAQSQTLDLPKALSGKTGTMTAYDLTAGTVTIDGVAYAIGIEGVRGAEPAAVASLVRSVTNRLGKTVTVILDDAKNAIVYITAGTDAAAQSTYLIFDQVIGATAQGYKIQAYKLGSTTLDTYTIYKANGITYYPEDDEMFALDYQYTKEYIEMMNPASGNFNRGDVIKLTRELDGTYSIESEIPQNYNYIAAQGSYHQVSMWYSAASGYTTALDGYNRRDVLNINTVYNARFRINTNNIAVFEFQNDVNPDVWGTTTNTFPSFFVTKDTIFFAYDSVKDSFTTYKVVGDKAATITFDKGYKIWKANGYNSVTETYIYINAENITIDGFITDEYDQVIYIDNGTQITAYNYVDGKYEVTYSYAIDAMTGKAATVVAVQENTEKLANGYYKLNAGKFVSLEPVATSFEKTVIGTSTYNHIETFSYITGYRFVNGGAWLVIIDGTPIVWNSVTLYDAVSGSVNRTNGVPTPYNWDNFPGNAATYDWAYDANMLNAPFYADIYFDAMNGNLKITRTSTPIQPTYAYMAPRGVDASTGLITTLTMTFGGWGAGTLSDATSGASVSVNGTVHITAFDGTETDVAVTSVAAYNNGDEFGLVFSNVPFGTYDFVLEVNGKVIVYKGHKVGSYDMPAEHNLAAYIPTVRADLYGNDKIYGIDGTTTMKLWLSRPYSFGAGINRMEVIKELKLVNHADPTKVLTVNWIVADWNNVFTVTLPEAISYSTSGDLNTVWYLYITAPDGTVYGDGTGNGCQMCLWN